MSTAVVLETFGYGCRDGDFTFALYAHLLACVVPIWKHGTEEMRAGYLPDLCSGKLIAVNGMTEPGTALARHHKDGFLINGARTLSSNGPVADVAVVYAATDPGKGYHGGITAFVVEKSTNGFRIRQTFEKMGLHNCPIAELILDNVFVPGNPVIGHVGSGCAILSQSTDWERACLVACHTGRIQWLLEQAIEYSPDRKAVWSTHQHVSGRAASDRRHQSLPGGRTASNL